MRLTIIEFPVSFIYRVATSDSDFMHNVLLLFT